MAKSGAIRAGRAYVELFADREGLERGLKQAQAQIKAFGSSLSRVGASWARAGALITAPLLAASAATVKVGDDFEKMATRTGASVEALSQLEFAADQSGTSINALEKGMSRMRRTIGDAANGNATAAKSLERLNLNYEQLQKLAPEQQLGLIADRINAIDDPNQRAAAGIEILGRGYEELIPLLEQGSQGIEAQMRAADELGLTMSKETAAAAAEMADEMGKMRMVMRSATLAVGSALLPVLKDAVKWVTQNVQRFRAWIEENEGLIRVALQVGGVIAGVGVSLILLGKIIGGVAAGVGALNAALMFLTAHPVIFALTVLTAGFVALTMAIQRANRSASDHADELQKINEAAERQRDSDRDRIRRLEALSEKQELSNSEMREASNLIAMLEGRYGEMGFVLDETARKLEAVAEAQERVNREMHKQAVESVLDEMEARRDAIAELERQIALREQVIADDPLRRDGGEGNSRRNLQRLQRDREQLEQELQRMEQLQERFNALRRGDSAAEESPAEIADTEIESQAEVGDEAERWARRVHQLKLQNIEDEFERDMALIDERYDYELQQAGDNAAAIEQIEKARELELERVRDQHRQRRLDEEKRAAEEAARHRERIDRLDQNQHRNVEELRLRTQLEGKELEEELLRMRERHALEDADPDQDLDAIREAFRLRRELLRREQEVTEARDRFGAMGGFAARNIEQTIGHIVSLTSEFGQDADEQTADHTRDIRDLLPDVAEDVRRMVNRLNQTGGGLVAGP